MADVVTSARAAIPLAWWYGFEAVLRRYPKPWLPNFLTNTRLFFAGPSLVLLYYLNWFSVPIVLFAYGVFCLTDKLDGWLARLWDCESEYGKKADETADKVIVIFTAGIVAFDWQMTFFELGLMAIMMWRELSIFSARHVFGLGASLPVSYVAKCKTAFQMVSVGCVLVRMEPLGDWWDSTIEYIGFSTLIIATALTIYSGHRYAQAALEDDPPFWVGASMIGGALLTAVPFALWWMYLDTGTLFGF